MIDYPDQVGRLLDQLSAALPIPARVTPELQMLLREKNGIIVPATCNVTWVSYAGDEGGIICQLDAGADTGAVVTSQTHQGSTCACLSPATASPTKSIA